ncbi:MAG: AAA family ATPase [Candidatus Aenigmarchaeota archaeon]|nr:AAA family ATPase [Candidatus Aenigmarchaeota archaeon]
MAYIKKLVLQGFKSFNKRIAIPFVNGMNIIVGPNGSGKSNIVDALCFVLGKISAKSLRANRLSELIFKGGDGKKPADVASVTIYLDNSKRELPFDENEVVITRKVNKKGYTIYKLNGKTVTREKILEVLDRINLRPDGYNIIFQGDVTRIIEMNPIQRREIIDQISGIYEYNDKKEKSLRDLERIEQRLREIEIIINQKYEQFKRLEEQRNAALKYKQLESRLRILRASFYFKKISILQQDIDEINNKINELQEKLSQAASELEGVEKNLEEKERNLKEIVKKILNLSKRLEKESEASRLRSELLVLESKLENNKNEIERLRSLVNKLSQLEEQTMDKSEMPPAVRAILQLDLRGVHGTIAQLMKVPEEYKTAIEVAAGNHLFDVVVDDFETAKYCIEYLKEERIGRATFLPLDRIRSNRLDEKYLEKDGVIGIASDLIKFDKRFEAALEFVFGNTLIIKNLDYARAIGIGRVRMVTLDGDLIERSGAVTGGFLFKKGRSALKKSYKEEIDQYLQSIKMLEEENISLETQIKEVKEKLKKFAPKQEQTENVELENLRVESEKELERLRKKRKKLFEEKMNIQMKISNLKIRRAKIEADIDNVKVELEEYKDAPEDQMIDEPLDQLRNEISKTLQEIKSLGTINFKAIEEYEKIKDEFSTLKEKFDKVVEEKERILQMIDEIEQKRREVFYAALKQVSALFDQSFNMLTGGTAKLELEDPENLESGLLIEASEPGKPFIGIDAMSGGEKTLVALAFLFALQKLKPAPFYVLDEVDAALDKENTENIGRFLKKISKESQIIMITHNDISVKYADTLYGVTMVGGESKIVALELPKESRAE